MGCITRLGMIVAIMLAVFAGVLFAAGSIQGQSHRVDQDQRQDASAGNQEPAEDGLPDLIAGLRTTPGCLGVETAHTESGKDVIFAWFEDKKSALRWYYSDMHTQVMKQFFPAAAEEHKALEHEPMADVPDDVPILTIASVTFADRAHFEGTTTLPISQIAVEMYTPVSGGVYLGGRFAPDTLKVDGLVNALAEHAEEADGADDNRPR